MPEYKAGDIDDTPLTVVNNPKVTPKNALYKAGDIDDEFLLSMPGGVESLKKEYYRDLSSMPIYGDTEEFNLPTLEDSARYDAYSKAKDQSVLEQFGGFLNQAVVGEIIGGSIQAAGSLLGIFDSLGKDKQDFNNVITNLGKNLQEWTQEVTPIYKENPYAAFDMTDSGWWFSNGVSVVSSLSMLIPARTAMGGLSLLGKAVNAEKAILNIGKLLNKTGKLDKIDDVTGALIKGEQILTNRAKYLANVAGTGVLMRHMENFREAGQVSTQTKDNALTLFNTLDDNGWNKWQEENEQTIKEYKNDLQVEEIDKEQLADYIGSKAAWLTYNSNWSNLIFDMIQVAPLFRGLKGATRGAGGGIRAATAEAEILGKTLTKGEKFAAYLNPMGNVLKRQWTEGIEEMVNGISEKEGMRLGRLLMGAEKDKDDFGDRLFNDYLQDPHIWEQGFWGVLGGITFETVSTGVQDKINKFKNPTYQSASDKIETEIVNRKAIVANFVAAKKAIETGKNVYKPLDESGTNYESFKGTEEEIAQQKVEAYERLTKDVGTELGLNASRAENVDGLLTFLDDKSIGENIAKENGIEITEATKIVNTLKDTILETESAYKKAFKTLSFTNLPQYIQEIIIPDNIRDRNQVSALQKERDKVSTNITNILQGNVIYETLDADQKTNVLNYIESKAAKEIKNALLEKIANEKNPKLKELLQSSYNRISASLEENIAKETTLNFNTLKTYGFGADIIDATANRIAIDFSAERLKVKMNNRTTTNEVEDTLKEKAELHKKKTEEEYIRLLSNIDLNGEWKTVEEQFNALQKVINKMLPNTKGTKINYKKDLAELKQKHANIQNGTTAPTPVFNVTLEQQQLMDLGVDFTDIKNQELSRFIESFSSDDFSVSEKILEINTNLVDAIAHLDKELQDKIIEYFTNKIDLLELTDINDTVNTVVPTQQIQDDNNINPFSEENNEESTKLENVTIEASEDGHINMFVEAMQDVNNQRNEKGEIEVDDILADRIRKIFSLRLGENLTLQIDTKNPDYNKDTTILNAPIVLTDKDGNNLGLYINKFSYLENELLMLNNLTKLSDEKILELIKAIKDKDFKTFADLLNKEIIKGLNIDVSHGGIEAVQKHFIKVLSWNTEEDVAVHRVSINAWKSKITRDYKSNYDIRTKIVKSKTSTDIVSVVKRTSGDLVISRNEAGQVIYNGVSDIFTNDVQLFIGKNQFIVNEKGQRENVNITKAIEGAVYTIIRENESNVPVLLQQNTIGSITEKGKVNAEKTADYITNLVLDLVDAIRSNDTEAQKFIKDKIDVYTYANRESDTNFNYFQWFGDSIKFNTPKGQYQLTITPKNIYIKDRNDLSKNLDDNSTIFENRTTTSSKAAINTLKSLLSDRLRNVNTKLLSSDKFVEEVKEYYDEATEITYPSYREYLFQNDILITRNSHIVDSKGNHISYFTNKAENNSSNWKTSRPLIINVASNKFVPTTTETTQTPETTQETEVDTTRELVQNAKSFTELHTALNLEPKYDFLYQLADDIGLIFDNNIQDSDEGRAHFLRGTIAVYNRFFTEGNKSNQQITLNHEILHGVIYNTTRNLSAKDANIFYGKLREFIVELLDKTKNVEEINKILDRTEIVNGIEVPIFNEQSKDYIKQVLDILAKKLESSDISDVEEVVTYAFSSPIFAKFLNNVESNLSVEDFNEGLKEKSFWTKLKDILLDLVKNSVKIFNGKVDKLSELNKILDTYIEVFQENDSITEAIEGQPTSSTINTVTPNEINVLPFEEITPKLEELTNTTKNQENVRLFKENDLSLSVFEQLTLQEQSLTSSKIIEDNYSEIINKLIENNVINKKCP